MNLVWTLLLLAAATGSVYSQYCLSHQGQEEYIRRECQSECSRQFPAIPFSNQLNLGGLFGMVTGFAISTANIVTCSTDYQYSVITVCVNLQSHCPAYSNPVIQAVITVPFTFGVQNGCPHYSFNTILSSCQLSIVGNSVTSLIGNALMNVIRPLVAQTATSVLTNVEANLSYGFQELTSVLNYGSAACHYSFGSLQQYGNSYTCGYSFYEDNYEPIVDGGYNDIAMPQPGEISTCVIPAALCSRMIHLSISGCATQFPLTQSHISDFGLEYAESSYLSVVVAPNPICTISEGGVSILGRLIIDVNLGGRVAARARFGFSANAHVNVGGGGGSLCFIIAGGISLYGELEVISVPDSCGCYPNIQQYLPPCVSSCLGALEVEINAAFSACLPWPRIGGYPGNGGSCATYNGCIRCSQSGY